ncbi:SMP-30/gluconolactonase/LRE family protein [Bacteroidota bacterium]
MDINVISEIKCLLGEGPYWDDYSDRIFWVDILNSKIYECDPQSENYSSYEVGQLIGCVVPGKDPDVVYLGLLNGYASFSKSNNELKMISDPEPGLNNNRFNDGKCDVMGRFWAGTMSMKDEPRQGALYCMAQDLSVKKKIPGVSVSNGLVWSLDHKTMYYIDTMTFQIVAYDFNPETGDITNPGVAVVIPENSGYPDGMTIDNEGKLWVAHWEGSQVCRWDPVSGNRIASIKLPVSKPTSCTFGGENFDRLFITSARVDISDEQLAREPLAGSLLVVDGLDVQGRKVNRFGV